ncbi:MAG: CoA pyrophosphatase, partial [Hyphomicrobiales bacterium]
DSRVWKGKRRYFYAMPYQDRYIWGATAGILRNMFERFYGDRG